MSQVEPVELEALYNRYGPVLFDRCRRILGNEEDARDALQETFARVMRSGRSFRAESSPLTWMYQISTNYCLNLLRNRRGRRDKRQVYRQDLPVGGPLPGPAEWERADLVRKLLIDADPDCRQVVIHLFFDDMSQARAAEMVGISIPTLRKRLAAFLSRARRQIEDPAVQALLLALMLCCLVGI